MTASTIPGTSVQYRSPARTATHHTNPNRTGTKTRYGAKGQMPAASCGTAPDHPTSASNPVGSSTPWITTSRNSADSATTGRRTDFMTLHRDKPARAGSAQHPLSPSASQNGQDRRGNEELPRKSEGVHGGRYWDRTSDLFR